MLKYASVATFSNGPGMSIEADVVARMNGGVSTTLAGGAGGMSTICLSRTNRARPSRLLCVTASSSEAGGWSFATSASTWAGAFAGSILRAASAKAR